MASETNDPAASPKRSDAENWASTMARLQVTGVPDGAINLNVEGRRVTSPLQGFGRMWQKTYRLEVGTQVAPTEVIEVWRTHFAEFWPGRNRFYGSGDPIAPGQVAVLNLAAPGRMQVATGVYVIYADDESFSFLTPEGHGFAGLITFSSEQASGGVTVAQVQALLRANDPFYEVGMWMGVQPRMEDRFWTQTLQALGRRFGVEGEVSVASVCVDRKLQWKNWTNLRHNAFLRTIGYKLATPVRAVARAFRKE